MLRLDWRALGAAHAAQGVHRPANANRGRSESSANHFGVLRGFVSAYSQNDVARTMQRLDCPIRLRADAASPPQLGYNFRRLLGSHPLARLRHDDARQCFGPPTGDA